MIKNTKEWLIVIGSSLLILIILGIAIGGAEGILGVILFLLLGGTVGIPLGLTSNAPNYAGDFRLYFSITLFTALALASFGLYHQKKIWGKILVITSVYLWCFAGFMALSLSY